MSQYRGRYHVDIETGATGYVCAHCGEPEAKHQGAEQTCRWYAHGWGLALFVGLFWLSLVLLLVWFVTGGTWHLGG